MFEVKVTLSTPELANAINNLAAAIGGTGAPVPVSKASSVPVSMPHTAPVSVQQAAPMQAPIPPVNQTVTAPVQQTLTPPAPAVPLAQAPQYTVDQIMAAGAALMDAGKGTELLNLLHSFGVQAVMDLKPEQLGAFATAMRNMGAKI